MPVFSASVFFIIIVLLFIVYRAKDYVSESWGVLSENCTANVGNVVEEHHLLQKCSGVKVESSFETVSNYITQSSH